MPIESPVRCNIKEHPSSWIKAGGHENRKEMSIRLGDRIKGFILFSSTPSFCGKVSGTPEQRTPTESG